MAKALDGATSPESGAIARGPATEDPTPFDHAVRCGSFRSVATLSNPLVTNTATGPGGICARVMRDSRSNPGRPGRTVGWRAKNRAASPTYT